jgi:hypothetical protein
MLRRVFLVLLLLCWSGERSLDAVVYGRALTAPQLDTLFAGVNSQP